MNICIFCKVSEGTMIHATKNGVVRYKCRPCQRMRIQTQKLYRELGVKKEEKRETAFSSKQTTGFDFHEASRKSVEALSKRSFYSR